MEMVVLLGMEVLLLTPKMGIDPNDPLLNEGDVTVWAIDPTKVSKINVIDY